jgi:uncharacterized protein (TIGR02271 family)
MDQDDNPAHKPRENAPNEVIALAREELRVTRQVVDRGGVRVRVSVNERDEAVDVLLREQDVQVERIPIGRVIEHPPETRQEGNTLVIPVVEEILVVERRLILREEIHIRRTERQRPARETARLRSEAAEVELIQPGKG